MAQAWSPNTWEGRQAAATGSSPTEVTWLPGSGLGMKIGTWDGRWLKGHKTSAATPRAPVSDIQEVHVFYLAQIILSLLAQTS